VSKPKKQNNAWVRRRRLYDVRVLLRSRYGRFLPDDDAGREDLRELLLPISTGSDPSTGMRIEIKHWAPWMSDKEASELIDDINQMPAWLRKPSSRDLGERMRLTNVERERLQIRTVKPFDMTDRALKDQRKAKQRERMRRLRKQQPRKQYLAQFTKSREKTKPWVSMGVSRATYFRRQQDRRETGCVRNISSTKEHQPSLTQPSLTAEKRLGEQPRENKSQSACRKLPATSTTRTVVAADATNRWGSHTKLQKRATQ